MMFDNISAPILQLAASLGGAAGFGFLIGYGVKKFLKLLLTILALVSALVLAPLAYLSSKGIITVDFAKFFDFSSSLGAGGLAWFLGLLQGFSLALSVLGSFGAGFVVGFGKG